MKFIRRYLLTGIIIILPVLLTTFLFLWLFRLLDGILGHYINAYLLTHYGYSIPGLGIIFGLLIVFLAGFFVTHLVNAKVIKFFENWFIKFPVIKQIYPATKKIVSFLFTDTRARFKKTVLIEYPRKGIYTLCFVTNEGFEHFNKKTKKELVNIFIPSTPGPLTGFFVMVPKEDVIVVDVPVEDALKMLISGGVVQPDSSPS